MGIHSISLTLTMNINYIMYFLEHELISTDHRNIFIECLWALWKVMHNKIIYSFLDNLCFILWQEMKEFQVVIMRISRKVFYQLTWTTPMTCHKYNRYIYFILYNVIYLKGVCSLHFCNKTIIRTLDTQEFLVDIYHERIIMIYFGSKENQTEILWVFKILFV